MATKKSELAKKVESPLLTLIVEYDAESYSAAEVIEAAQELIEAATGSEYVVTANLVNLPSEIDLI